MNKIFKILGKRGRITIPWEIRQTLGFAAGDLVSFALGGDTVLVRREKVCKPCKTPPATTKSDRTVTLLQLLDDLSPAEFRAALMHLSVKWAEMQGCGGDA